MSAARKKPAAPDMGALKDDWGRLTEMRRQEHEDQSAPTENPPPAQTAPEPAAARPTMTRRSWYIERDVADAVQAAVDDIHFATRVPKNVVLSRLLQEAVAHADEVAKKL